MVLGVAESVHVVEVGTGGRGVLCLERNFTSRSPNDGGQRVSQRCNVVLHVFQVPLVQLGHLVPEAGILLDHGSLGQIFRFVSVNLLPDVVAGIDVRHHVIQNRLF